MNETNKPACPVAGKIFDRLDSDIRDRRGIKHEWGAIDDDVMNDEIRPKWEAIIAEEIARAGGRQPEPSAEASDKHIALQGLVRLLESATRLNEIVEGCSYKRWTADGLRLKDTPEWCDFYCKLKAAAQQPNA